jgi:hypothetical protein
VLIAGRILCLESQLAEMNKLYKIWDYGKKKWTKYLI